jgi:hypothetical protein
MDGDRQNDPSDIPGLVKYLEENDLDVVSGWRNKRKDNLFKRIVSRGASLLRALIISDGIHDSGCSLKIYKKECFDHLNLYGEMHRFIPALLKIKGFKIGELVVNHRPRIAGKTKYNWRRTIKGFIDMIAIWFWKGFAVRPLHLLGGLGILCVGLGVAISILGVYLYVIGNALFRNILPILAAFLFLTGLQLFVFGLMADMLSKSYFETTNDTSYSIKEVIEN